MENNSKREKNDVAAGAKPKKKLQPPAIAAIAIVCILVTAFSVFLPLYLKENKTNRDLYKKEQIKITAYGKELGIYTLSRLLDLEGVEEVNFTATYDTSNSEPVQKTYTGIELKKVLIALDVNMSLARKVVLVASDGACRIYAPEQVLAGNNVFIAYKVDGKPFNNGIKAMAYKDKAEDGGPFVVIRVSDPYSNNRCKLLTGVTIE